MKHNLLIFFICIFISINLSGQTRTIIGRVITEDLEILPQVRIQNSDTVLLATTDIEGRFKIQVSSTIDELIISWIGMEWATIKFPINCDNLEIILMYDGTYDFMTAQKVDRLRMKRFKKLPETRQTAFNKGIFVSEKPCYSQDFVADKKRLKEIHRQRRAK